MNIWMEIEKLKGQTLRTLAQGRPFLILDVDNSSLIIRPHSTKYDRPISRSGIELAYRYLMATGQLTIKELETEFTPRSQVYTATILARFPTVRYSLHPTRLWIDENPEANTSKQSNPATRRRLESLALPGTS
jgi:hypothetical protein